MFPEHVSWVTCFHLFYTSIPTAEILYPASNLVFKFKKKKRKEIKSESFQRIQSGGRKWNRRKEKEAQSRRYSSRRSRRRPSAWTAPSSSMSSRTPSVSFSTCISKSLRMFLAFFTPHKKKMNN